MKFTLSFLICNATTIHITFEESYKTICSIMTTE